MGVIWIIMSLQGILLGITYLSVLGLGFDLRWLSFDTRDGSVSKTGNDRVAADISDNQVAVPNYIALAPERRDQEDSYSSRAWIYVYRVEDGTLIYDEQMSSDTPFPCFLPHMVYNVEKESLEVIGDWRKTMILQHFFVSFPVEDGQQAASWDRVDDSNYDGRMASKAIYTDELGTVLIGGWGGLSQLKEQDFVATNIQVYSPEAWNGEYATLPELATPRDMVGATYFDRKLYIVGGYSHQETDGGQITDLYHDTFAYLDLEGVGTPEQASQLSWTYMKPLTKAAMPQEIRIVQHHKDGVPTPKAIVYGGIQGKRDFVTGHQVYDLVTETSVYYDGTFSEGRYKSASILTGPGLKTGVVDENDLVLTVLGGEFRDRYYDGPLPTIEPYHYQPAMEQARAVDLIGGLAFEEAINDNFNASIFAAGKGGAYVEAASWTLPSGSTIVACSFMNYLMIALTVIGVSLS